MKYVDVSNKFKRDLKRVIRRGCPRAKLEHIVDMLAKDVPLPISTRPHKLSGNWLGYWECHIEPDWLLIYKVTEDIVFLAETGSHTDLFE